MRTLTLLAIGVMLLAGCAGPADKAEATQQRRDLDSAGRQVTQALNELVPTIARELRTTLHGGFTGWASCTEPVAGNAQAIADVQFDAIGLPTAEAVGKAAAALRTQGWSVSADPRGGVKAHRSGIDLILNLQGIVQSMSLRTACVETSKDVDQEYAGRQPRHLPVPWPASGIG